jgi:hypothetical protein
VAEEKPHVSSTDWISETNCCTDAGPDHCTNFITVILAAVALFIKENLDILVQMRTPPGLSIRNVAERAMPLINYGCMAGVLYVCSWAMMRKLY